MKLNVEWCAACQMYRVYSPEERESTIAFYEKDESGEDIIADILCNEFGVGTVDMTRDFETQIEWRDDQ